MTALPRKCPTGGQRLKKSNRVYPRYDLGERLKGLKKKKNQKTFFGQQGQPSNGQSLNAQPQRGWTAQPPENQQQLPVGNWWRAMILILLAILALIVVAHIILSITPNPGSGQNPGGDDCTCYCEDGSTCTSNPQCPDSPPGVPGICGCPVGCS